MRIVCLTLVLICTCTSAFAYTKLFQGKSGSDVLTMQKALNTLGYNLKEDGKFGAGTKEAVKHFQKNHGLTCDGVAGNQTLTLLYSLTSGAAPAPTAVPTAAPTKAPVTNNGSTVTYQKLQRGDKNAQVADMQRALTKLGFTLTADGNFGSGTYAAVRAFQKQYGLKVDGVAGNKTLTLLYTLANQASNPIQPTAIPTAAPTQAPLPTVPVSSTGMTARVTTTGGSLNFRKAPRDNADVICTIPFGTVLNVATRGSEWCTVTYANQTGYVMTKFLVFLSTGTPATQLPTQAPTATPQPNQGSTSLGVAIVSTSGGTLNFREQPGGSVMMQIPNTAVLQLLEKGNDWCRVTYQGRTGYVMTKFLTIMTSSGSVNRPTATPQPTQIPSNNNAAIIGKAIVSTTGGTLNFREQPSSGASVMMQIPNTSPLDLLERGADWCKVIYNGRTGYVMSKFITVLTSSGSATPTQAPTVQLPTGGGSNATEEEENDPSVYTRTLKSGMYGEDVRWVQERLKELKYTVNVTGTYDASTVSAVKAFQSQNSLTSDGICGEQTFAILNSSNARAADDAPLTYKTLRIDDASGAVTALQNRLKALGYPLNVTGEYDVKTHDAVVGFQQRNGLVISGIADALTQSVLYASSAKDYSTPITPLDPNAGKIQGPALSQVKLLHWFNDIKPTIKAGQTMVIFDPATSLSWNIKLYSLGRHADSQPASFRDTQIMNRSFGAGSWTCHPVYVQLPDGQWTLASMHNRPHLYGSINNNGFGGHLCIHFLRDMDECKRNDPDYGVSNQNTIRNAWKALTGEVVE